MDDMKNYWFLVLTFLFTASLQAQINKFTFRTIGGPSVGYRVEESFVFAGDTLRKDRYPSENYPVDKFDDFYKRYVREIESDYWT
ncbi:MAG: hypothetical protein D6698_10095, partial [Gammaproteobacteria bacterium]